jgi:beta-glucosidase
MFNDGCHDVNTASRVSALLPATTVNGVSTLKGFQVKTIEDLQHQNQVQLSMMNSSRLGIPIDFTAEILHSGGMPGTTIFPMPMLQGSSWNVSLVRHPFLNRKFHSMML